MDDPTDSDEYDETQSEDEDVTNRGTVDCSSEVDLQPQLYDEFQQDLETERKVIKNVSSIEAIKREENVDYMAEFIKKRIERSVVPKFQDITNLFSDESIFLVDGDSLVLNIMADENYDSNHGGQILHFIYLCERLLQLFARKGGKFEVVFFNIWKKMWTGKHSLLLARSVLIYHLKVHMKCTVHKLESIWNTDFSVLLQKQKCGFILIDYEFTEKLKKILPNESCSLHELIVGIQMCYSLMGLDLACVDMNRVDLGVSTLNAFYCSPVARLESRNLRRILNNIILKIEQITEGILKLGDEVEMLNYETNDGDVRSYVTILAAAQYLKVNCISETTMSWITAFLIYSALLDVMPLKSRGCIKVIATPTEEFTKFVDKIQEFMYLALDRINCNNALNFKNISDLWHGNFFVSVIEFINRTRIHVLELGGCVKLDEQALKKFEELRTKVGELVELPSEKFSTVLFLRLFKEEAIELRQGDKIQFPISLTNQLIPTSCMVTYEFCKNILSEVKECELDATLNNFITSNSKFDEIRHWHSKKPLTDEYDYIKDDSRTKVSDPRIQKLNSQYAHYMSLYGSSIEGKPLSTKPIVCENTDSSRNRKGKERENSKNPYKSKKTEKKASEGAKKIIDNRMKAKCKEDKEYDTKILSNLKEIYNKCKTNGSYRKILSEIENLEKKLKTDDGVSKVLFFKAKVLWQLWKEECLEKLSERNLMYAKELFIVIRKILTKNEELSSKDKEQISAYLHEMGFEKIAEFWNLPRPANTMQSASVRKSWVEFQLLDMGTNLEKEGGSITDNRVDFKPDDWQRALFDCIDKRQSVLVVAPTSSGKTYASYYCMEQVLRADNDGLVVYVSPTKALVNQVAATVYARFKNKNMPQGKSVYGVLTRDYRVNASNCQILITVPECLEILLLSPRRHDWVSRLRYVIFDEIHCLAGQAGGFTWESGLLLIQCPFIALSATIEEPEVLHRWLQNMQNFKKSMRENQNITVGANSINSYKVNLVVHRERHGDLIKYVYCNDGKLHHIHPYAYLDGSVISVGIPSGITLSPDEVQQLYSAMKTAFPGSPELEALDPERFFSYTRGFISRKSVREFESRLSNLLQNWAKENYEIFETVLSQLDSVDSPLNDECELLFIQDNIEQFIDHLQDNNMLPALLFSYNRAIVVGLLRQITEYFELTKEEIDNMSKNTADLKPEKVEKEPPGARGYREKDPPFGILSTEGSQYNGVKQVGLADEKIVKYLERQLRRSGLKRSDLISRGLNLGVGMHHGGLNRKIRGAVEMLFRMRVLNVVFATGTLALGIHMPCKTVAVIGDSPFLNTLEYQQMSGRAGRRGFDTVGSVVFMGLNERKMKRLLLGKLPKMIGNFPLSVTMVLRVLLLVSTVTSRGERRDDVTRNTLSRVLTMLEWCLVYESIPELRDQMRHFFAFATQLLMLQGLLDDKGHPQFLTGIVTHLHYHEPGNLAFVFLMKSGILRGLCKPVDGVISHETEMNLVLVLSYLFAPLKLHKRAIKLKYNNSKVILPPLPPEIKMVLEDYNKQVLYIFDNYFRAVASHCSQEMGEDNTLPMSGVSFEPSEPFKPSSRGDVTIEKLIMEHCEPRTVCSSFAALSGHTDRFLYSHSRTSNIRHQVFTDVKVIPIVELDTVYNGYAWDFYNHGIAAAIRRDNRLKQGDDFTLLKDFMLVLKCIQTSLTELEPVDEDDPILKTFNIVTTNFTQKFLRVYS